MADELNYSRPTSGAAVADAPDSPSPAKPKKRTAAELADFLKLARDRFAQAEEADKKQRERELEDLRFYAGDQWPSDIRQARSAQAASGGLPPVPARPCLTIDTIRQSVLLVQNEALSAELDAELVPADDFEGLGVTIDETEITLRESLIRRIHRAPETRAARLWGFARGLQAGRGFWQVMTKFAPGKTWDQDVSVQGIYNQAAVSLDPARDIQNGIAPEWGFVSTDMPWAKYKATYPKVVGKPNQVALAEREEFRALGDQYPTWFKTEGETRSCRVVDYYYTVRESRTLALMPDDSVEWEDELHEGDPAPVDTREVIEQTVMWAQIDATQILDETEWPGPDVPIVEFVATELQPYDNERRCEGMVRPARDSQQGKNFMVSRLVEAVALAPIPPLMVPEGTIETYEEWYKVAPTRTLPYLPFKTTDLEGRQATPPFRTPAETPIQAIAAAIAMFNEGLQVTTNVPDAAMGKTDPGLKSAKARAQVIQQAQQGTSNFLDNLARAVRYETQIENNLLYPIYNRKGRIARILNGQGEPQAVMLHTPSITQGGKPMAAPLDPLTQQPMGNAKTYTLTKDAHFNIAIKVGKNYDLARQEENEALSQVIQSAPQEMMAIFGDLFFKTMTTPGHQEMAERAKAMLAPPIQALLQSEASGQAPPSPLQQQMQNQLQQAHQTIQQLQQDKAGHLAVAQVNAQSALELARENNATKIAVARITAGAKGAADAMEDAEERIALGQQIAADQQGQSSAQAHDVALASVQHAHALVQGHQAAVASQQAAQQDAGNQQQLAAQQAQQQQAAQPPPGQPAPQGSPNG